MDPWEVRSRITRCATDAIAQHGWTAEAVEHMCGRSGVLTTEYIAAYPEFHGLFDDLYSARMTEIVRCIVEVTTLSRAFDQPPPATVPALVAPLLRLPRHYDAWWITSSEYAIRSNLDSKVTAHYVDAHNDWHDEMARRYDEIGDNAPRSPSSVEVADAIIGPRSSAANTSALRLAQAERSAWLALIPWVET